MIVCKIIFGKIIIFTNVCNLFYPTKNVCILDEIKNSICLLVEDQHDNIQPTINEPQPAMKITRTFDLLTLHAQEHKKDDALASKVNGTWVKISSKEYYEKSTLISYVLSISLMVSAAWLTAFSIPSGFFPPAVAKKDCPPPPPCISAAASRII